MQRSNRVRWKRALVIVGIVGLVALSLCGCQTAQFYRQAIRGEVQILTERKPIDKLLADPQVSAELKQRFELVKRLRQFAQADLKLPIDEDYLTYVDLHRRFVVWNVFAAPEFSLEPKKWWYPLVGSLKYRGYFSQKDATNYAATLDHRRYDVYVEGVEAYSTLGWFADPLLNTFIFHSEPDLAETVFHELAHRRLFLNGDTEFNEAFATAVSEEGVRRWYEANKNPGQFSLYQTELARSRQFVGLVMHTRQRLQDLYGPNPEHPKSAPEWERAEKARIIQDLRDSYERLKKSWGGYSGYDRWFSRSLNNAQLNTVALYYDLVPGFQVLLERAHGDLELFYNNVSALKKLSKDERHRRLHELGATNPSLSTQWNPTNP